MSALGSMNAESRCPSIHGGTTRHTPRISSSGTPITMPYLDQRYGGPQIVILAACCKALLVPPNGDEQTETVQCGGVAIDARQLLVTG